MLSNNVILQTKGISKSFPGVKAVDKIEFKLLKGEVHALLGENGAGKSTFVKILSGAYTYDEGEIFLNGKRVFLGNPRISRELGISIVYQELNLIPYLDIAQNIFLGREPLRYGFIDWKRLYREAKKILDSFEIGLDVKSEVRKLGIAEQQIVEICRSISQNAKIVIMDEPTSSLNEKEIDKLFDFIDSLKNKDIGIIYISHRIPEVFRIADNITVFRNGEKVVTKNIDNVTHDDIVKYMIGKSIEEKLPKHGISSNNIALSVKNLAKKNVYNNISFDVKEGEILGIAGLMGAGQSELAKSIFGAYPKDSGEIYCYNNKESILSPAHAISAKISLLTDDRRNTGLILDAPIFKNISLASLDKFSKYSFISKTKEIKNANNYVDLLNIRTTNVHQSVQNLSGGNQQKVVLSKWLTTGSSIMILDNPTKGIDVNAKYEIYRLIIDLAKKGIAIIFISLDVPELLKVSDRILVIYKGEIKGEFFHKSFCKEKIMRVITGGEDIG